MFPSFFSDVYKKSSGIRFPAGAELVDNTSHPNLNSDEYRQVPVERTVKIHPVWEAISINSKKHIIIGTNKCTGREWGCGLWGFENYKNISEKTHAFRLPFTSLITNVEYVTNKIFLATFRNGCVELWSTHTEVRNPQNPYCLFNVARTYEHKAPIECLELMEPGTNKAITGGEDFTLKVWEWSEEELQSSSTYRYAHNDAITGISQLKTNDSIFATCSRDKTTLLWDLRLVRPALALYADHYCSFQGISWLSPSESNENTLFVGDAAGFIHAIDKRSNNKFLLSTKLFSNSIRKILCNGDKLAIIANTNTVKVFSGQTARTIYENDSHTHFVRDCAWYNNSKLLTVGCDTVLHEHNINS